MVGQGTVMLGRVNDGTDDIVNTRMPRIDMTTRTLTDVNDIAIALRNMMLIDSAEDRAKHVEEMTASRKNLDAVLAQLDHQLTSARGRALLAQQVELNAKYTRGQQELIRLIQSGDDAGARAYLETTLRPSLADYKAVIDRQVQAQAELAAETAKDAHTCTRRHAC
jgi:methyl-accepting chemotaxis protein